MCVALDKVLNSQSLGFLICKVGVTMCICLLNVMHSQHYQLALNAQKAGFCISLSQQIPDTDKHTNVHIHSLIFLYPSHTDMAYFRQLQISPILYHLLS